ncbi:MULTISPECIES: hypothetical protein [Micromonospora]|uniref:hypothetical protein n=1 Tax=Micromonospora TaxID=1873 RepID=UPI001EEFE2F1|nr:MULTISPECIES: hypothetical protein [unclassified Micromonospora]
MDNRTDPIEIIARVSEQDGKQRAFEVWLYKANKEGWSVAVESTSVEAPGDECGVVDIEGLRSRSATRGESGNTSPSCPPGSI